MLAEKEREHEQRHRRVPVCCCACPRLPPARGGQRAGTAAVAVQLLRRRRVRHPALHAHPSAQLALVQVPDPEARAPAPAPVPCNASENCPATVLLTGQNRQLAEGTEHTYVCPCQNFQFAWKSCSYLGANCSVLDEFFFAVLGSLLFPPVPVQYALAPDASNSSDYLDEFSSAVPVSCLINPYFHSTHFIKRKLL